MSLYKDKVTLGLSKLEFELKLIESETDTVCVKRRLTEVMPKISSTLFNALERTMNTFKNKKKTSKKRKNKSLWDENCQRLFEIARNYYLKYKQYDFNDNELKLLYSKAKSDFRAQKRINIKIKQGARLRKLCEMLKLSKSKFWKQIKQIRSDSQTIDMPACEIASEYLKLFNTNNNRDAALDSDLKAYVDKFIQEHKAPSKVSLNINQILDYIASISADKAVGVSGISNKMLKATVDTQLPSILKLIFEKCINFGVTPYFFNISIVKPLIKDSNKDTLSINNLRPVAISDVISNMYESVLLDRLNVQFMDNPKQFSFKSFS